MLDDELHSKQESYRDPLLGQSLNGKYTIEEKIAVGGMCSVYRAVQPNIGKTVAVKVLLPQLSVDERVVRRFEHEARAASLIHHPHAINVFDFGYASDGRPFIAMDFIRGESLDAVLRWEGALPLSRAGELLRQVCSALQAAHEQGVVHRDVKPSNIIISETDGQDWVTVVDFGVAKIQEDLNRRTNLTAENVIVGTPRYISPEQAEGGAGDARSDIYSLGIVLYEMLAGAAPFMDDSSTRLLLKHITEPPLPLRKKRPDLPVEVERIVMNALAKEPSARPASVLELSTAFYGRIRRATRE
jgi:serine/threonine protein kinase